jgi:hypothetical protein
LNQGLEHTPRDSNLHQEHEGREYLLSSFAAISSTPTVTVDFTLFNINRWPWVGKGKTRCKGYKSSSKADDRQLHFEERLGGSVRILKL